jgi:transposase
MKNRIRFVGLDVHKKTIAVAVANQGESEVRSMGTIPNEPTAIARLMRKLGRDHSLHVCYEAGPTGYVLYWQLTKLEISCVVIAPSLVPTKPGDRVKTDPVWVPTKEHEALRDVVRAREAAKKDQRRSRNRMQKFLLRQGVRVSGHVHRLPWAARRRLACKLPAARGRRSEIRSTTTRPREMTEVLHARTRNRP